MPTATATDMVNLGFVPKKRKVTTAVPPPPPRHATEQVTCIPDVQLLRGSLALAQRNLRTERLNRLDLQSDVSRLTEENDELRRKLRSTQLEVAAHVALAHDRERRHEAEIKRLKTIIQVLASSGCGATATPQANK